MNGSNGPIAPLVSRGSYQVIVVPRARQVSGLKVALSALSLSALLTAEVIDLDPCMFGHLTSLNGSV